MYHIEHIYGILYRLVSIGNKQKTVYHDTMDKFIKTDIM